MLVIALVAVLVSTLGSSQRRSHRRIAPAVRAIRQPHHPAMTTAIAPLPKMLGQMIVARFAGTAPSASLLSRIRDGHVGGVILFADNLAGGIAVARDAVHQLQRAAAQGHNPPLLVMVDQEGGAVNRVPGPPTLAPSQMTSPGVAFAQGRETGQLLRSLGVNVDLAPVADVEGVPGSFLGTRAFGSSPSAVADNACGFARGLASQRVIYTLKHFPGLGLATTSTDSAPVSIDQPSSTLRSGYVAYRACGGGPLAMVMVSSAIYPSLTGPLPAVMSPLTYSRELPDATSHRAVVTISDDLQAPAITDQTGPARHAIDAGLDLLLYAGTEQASASSYTTLLNETHSGDPRPSRIRAAYDAILALKRRAMPSASAF